MSRFFSPDVLLDFGIVASLKSNSPFPFLTQTSLWDEGTEWAWALSGKHQAILHSSYFSKQSMLTSVLTWLLNMKRETERRKVDIRDWQARKTHWSKTPLYRGHCLTQTSCVWCLSSESTIFSGKQQEYKNYLLLGVLAHTCNPSTDWLHRAPGEPGLHKTISKQTRHKQKLKHVYNIYVSKYNTLK